MTIDNYMALLNKAKSTPNDNFHSCERSEMVERLVYNYPKIFAASGNDKGDKIFNRAMNLMGRV